MTSRSRWTLACTMGEAVGMMVVALGYTTLERGLSPLPPVAQIALAGAAEGASLGLAQALALRQNLPRSRWILLTIAAALAGYALAGLAGAGGSESSEPPLGLILAGGAGIGLVLGAFFGAAQSIVLPSRRISWVIRNALGWAPGMAAVMAAATLAPSDASLISIAGLGLAAGAFAGAALGAITGPPPADRNGKTGLVSN